VSERPKLRVPQSVVELIRSLHPDLKRKVRAAMDAIVAEPESGKALRSELEGLRSFRVGRTRVIYRVARAQIEIVAIGPRTTIYEDMARLLVHERDARSQGRDAAHRQRASKRRGLR
jgi:mRNA interferase RelE/StbE